MHPSTTSAATESAGTGSAGTGSAGTESAGTNPSAGPAVARRGAVALILAVEFVLACLLLSGWRAPASPPAASATPTPALAPTPNPNPAPTPAPAARQFTVIPLGGSAAAALAERIRAETPTAEAAVTAFWGDDWRRDVEIVVTDSADRFAALGNGGREFSPDIAAVTTGERIVFAPGAAGMGPGALRIVLRHELFHYAARLATAADAPRWLTEGVADYVGRPAAPRPGPAAAAELARLPTDADLDDPGAVRSQAYDRAWWFARFVADRYGVGSLRALYVAACAPGHADVPTAIRTTLGVEPRELLAQWGRWLAD